MEYQFIKNSLTGDYHIRCSMGHEIIGRWLLDEVGPDEQKLELIMRHISELKLGRVQEAGIEGKEISISLTREDVVVQEHALNHSELPDEFSEFDFYDCESSACCGLEDFEQLLFSWMEFIRR